MDRKHLPSLGALIPLLLLFGLPVPSLLAQAQTARLELISASPKIDPATATATSGVAYEVQFTTLTAELNGELQPAPLNIPFDLHSTLVLQSATNSSPLLLDFAIDLPFFADANDNSIFDFFDQDAAVANVTVRGQYMSPLSGTQTSVEAVWSRPAGNLSGLLRLTFSDLGLVTEHNFRILAFKGDFDYSRSGQQLTGNVELASPHDPADILTGPLALTIQDPLTLTASAGVLQNALQQSYQFSPDDNFDHVGARYWSNFILTDGDPSTSGQDFNEWMAFLDGADTDADGIPNLVDDPPPPVIPPSLLVSRVPSGIRLTLSGTAGSTYLLEACPEVNGSWSSVQTIILVTKTHSITLPSSAPGRLFRLKLL